MYFQSWEKCGSAASTADEKRLARTVLLLARYGKPDKPEKMIPKLSQETLAQKKTQVARTQLKELVAQFPENPLFASELFLLPRLSPQRV
jgi:hypothetical protein